MALHTHTHTHFILPNTIAKEEQNRTRLSGDLVALEESKTIALATVARSRSR